jgi:hypothetical protein
MIAWIRSLRGRSAVAAIVVTVLTLVLIGGVILTTTSAGCGAAQKLGLKGALNQCKATALRIMDTRTPSPSAYPSFATPSDFPPPNPNPNPASAPNPPNVNPASPSGAYPPFYPPASPATDAHVALSCRLPVYAGQAGSGGFIVFPGATFVADPKSAVTLPSPSPGSTPAPSPVPGYGQGYYTGLSYDHAYSRWLPVQSSWVSPDGSRYAYLSADSIYVVNVASGTQIELGQGHSWTIVGVGAQGVYASYSNQGGLWFLPFTGAAQQITTSGYWQAVSTDAAYGTPTSAVPQGAVNNIVRVDLKTGAMSDWFTHENTQSSVAGLDGKGHPIIYVNYFIGGNEIWIAAGPKDASPIAGAYNSNGNYSGFSPNGTPIADSHGIWIPGNYTVPNSNQGGNGIALYVPGSGLYMMSGIGGPVAGVCA